MDGWMIHIFFFWSD